VLPPKHPTQTTHRERTSADWTAAASPSRRPPLSPQHVAPADQHPGGRKDAVMAVWRQPRLSLAVLNHNPFRRRLGVARDPMKFRRSSIIWISIVHAVRLEPPIQRGLAGANPAWPLKLSAGASSLSTLANQQRRSRSVSSEGAQLIVLSSLNMKVMQHAVKNRSEHKRRSNYDNQPGENCVRASKDFAGRSFELAEWPHA
jgi:hypothetical protein